MKYLKSKKLFESVDSLTKEEKDFIEMLAKHADSTREFTTKESEMKNSIFSKLGIGGQSMPLGNWELGTGY
jgi:hypothetical protein